MIIYKSQIKIKNKDDKSSLNCELLTRVIYEKDVERGSLQEFESVLIMQDAEGKYSMHDIEEYSGKNYYNSLKRELNEHEEYRPNIDMQYIIDVFGKNNALSYLDMEKYSRIVKIQNVDDVNNNVKLEIVSYELDEKMILNDFLGKSFDILDLHDDMFEKMINKYIEKKLLIRKMKFLKSLGVRRQYISGEIIAIEKINKHEIFQINIYPLDKTILEYKEVDGIKVAFTKVHQIINKTSFNKAKDVLLSESNSGHDMVLIIDRGKYQVSEIIDIFHLDYFIKFGKIVVGVTNCDNVKFLD